MLKILVYENLHKQNRKFINYYTTQYIADISTEQFCSKQFCRKLGWIKEA